jgi:capsular polysaccharide transport system permease protein
MIRQLSQWVGETTVFQLRKPNSVLFRSPAGASPATPQWTPAGQESVTTSSKLSAAKLFILCVILPTLLAGLYFGVWASERYVSEASFVVRTASKSGGAGLGGFLQMTGIVRSQDDAFTVHEYMTSRDAVNELGRQLPLREIFGRPEADFLARFPSVLYGSTDEELYLYYQKMVEVIYNSTTGISALRVQAFRPEDAEHLSRALLTLSEELVNRLNARIVNDAITLADALWVRSWPSRTSAIRS